MGSDGKSWVRAMGLLDGLIEIFNFVWRLWSESLRDVFDLVCVIIFFKFLMVLERLYIERYENIKSEKYDEFFNENFLRKFSKKILLK